MKERFLTQADIQSVRTSGLKIADSIAMTMKTCGHNSIVEPFLWDAFNLGYEAGKKHQKRARENNKLRAK